MPGMPQSTFILNFGVTDEPSVARGLEAADGSQNQWEDLAKLEDLASWMFRSGCCTLGAIQCSCFLLDSSFFPAINLSFKIWR